MILVDTSVWIDHFRMRDAKLSALLRERRVLMHNFVMGEVALGRFRSRKEALLAMRQLPRAATAGAVEVLDFIDRHDLAGRGIGYVDLHLLIAVAAGQNISLWARDRRLAGAAEQIGLPLVE